MIDANDFVRLRQLCDIYYQRQIDFESYRIQRKEILDRIEGELNHLSNSVPAENITQPKPIVDRDEEENVFSQTHNEDK